MIRRCILPSGGRQTFDAWSVHIETSGFGGSGIARKRNRRLDRKERDSESRVLEFLSSVANRTPNVKRSKGSGQADRSGRTLTQTVIVKIRRGRNTVVFI